LIHSFEELEVLGIKMQFSIFFLILMVQSV